MLADAVCDVAVIGAGILGLCTALALAERGRSVIVLDAAGIGAGASGRNGGLVVPSLPRVGPQQAGDALARLVAGAADAVFALVRRHGIDCASVQRGWLQPAHAASLVPALRARADGWRRVGGAAVMLDAAETRRRLGSDDFHGALFDPTGGHLNPLAYARGLARAVLSAGGTIHTGTPVHAAEPGQGWRLHTPGGTVAARQVVQCTNAQPPGVSAAVRDSVVPLTVFQLATPPLPARPILAVDEAFSDTRHNLLACRWTADDRLVTGGLASALPGSAARLPDRLARRLERVFPSLGPVRFDFAWTGRAALTGDFLPRVFQPAPDWLAPVGCNGRGIALCTVLGDALGAYLVAGRSPPVPIIPPAPWRLPGFARRVPALLLPIGDWQDRRAARRPP